LANLVANRDWLTVTVLQATACIFSNSKKLQRHDSVHLSSVYTDYSFSSFNYVPLVGGGNVLARVCLLVSRISQKGGVDFYEILDQKELIKFWKVRVRISAMHADRQ